MDQTTITKMTYKTGSIVPVTDDLVKKMLSTAESDLGFPESDHALKLMVIPERLKAILPMNASVSVKKETLYTPSELHEAVIYHEGIHYIMGKNGLLFAPDIRIGGLYERLIDETMAELATSQRFGYSDMFSKDSGTLLATLLEKATTGNERGERASYIEDMLQIVRIPGNIIMGHREIEDRYRDTQDLDATEKDLKGFFLEFPYHDSNLKGAYSESIRVLATDNAKRLTAGGIRAQALVEALADGVQNRRQAYTMYFTDIVGGQQEGH